MLNIIYGILTYLGYISPIHPPLTHIPIGLVTGALVFGIIALIARSEELTLAARACAMLALVFAFITVFFGFLDWQHYYSGGWLYPIKMKLVIAGILVGLLLLAEVLGQGVKIERVSVLVVYALCFLAVTGLGWFGDKLTYSARVEALPGSLRPGAILFVNNCYSCHPDGGNLITPQLEIRSSQKLRDFSSFLTWVRRPNPPMPSFLPSRLPDSHANVLYQFLRDFIWKPQGPAGEGTAQPPPAGQRAAPGTRPS